MPTCCGGRASADRARRHAQPGAYPQPGVYPQQGGYAPGYPAKSETGAIAWGLGFLGFIPIPILGMLVTVGVMVGVGLAQRKHGGVAAGNGRSAANWALTLLVLQVLAWVLVILGVVSMEPGSEGVPVLGSLGLIVMFGSGIVHLVMIIVGLVKAGRGEVHRGLGIPFFRE